MHPCQRAKQRRRTRARDAKKIMNKFNKLMAAEPLPALTTGAIQCLVELYRRGALR